MNELGERYLGVKTDIIVPKTPTDKVIAPTNTAPKRAKKFPDATPSKPSTAAPASPVPIGARLTSFELTQAEISSTVLTDSTAGFLMKKGLIDMVIVGADRVTSNGDVANKIGTYSLAILCKYHKRTFQIIEAVSPS